MQTPKEIMLELLKPDGHPERQLKQYEALNFNMFDPASRMMRSGIGRGNTGVNPWGVTISWPEWAPGPMPVTTEELKVVKDITAWKDSVKLPQIEKNAGFDYELLEMIRDLDQESLQLLSETGQCGLERLKDRIYCLDEALVKRTAEWELARRKGREACGPDRLMCAFMGTGIFEQLHYLMGFEDTLTNLYDYPDEIHELIEAILSVRLEYARLLMDGLKPDVLFTHDDWGTKDALFMNPEMWREFFKEPYARFYGEARKRGIIAVHHADSYCAPIIGDMVDVGIQVWQGVLPENDIPAMQAETKGRLVYMGGLGAAIDRADSTEEEIRGYTRNILETCCPGGHFIPCITYGLPGSVFPHVDPVLNDEIDRYNSRVHLPKVVHFKTVRRKLDDAAKGDEGAAAVSAGMPSKPANAEDPGISGLEEAMASVENAVYRGQKKKLLAAIDAALKLGADANTIISGPLVSGMEKIGLDFSAGRAFVPEMLISAKCMDAATEKLKPLMHSDKTASGRVCLGTVQGDMHDIGQKLVKIMMEGAGLTVYDLGVDTPAEKFIDTAIENDCQIIALSSLLTTSMPHMLDVVELAKERGIRDRVKIMIGGAPVTQEYCDQIGADAYTKDAAAAARLAVQILSE